MTVVARQSEDAPSAEDVAALKTRLNTARAEIEAALNEAKNAAETIIGRAEALLAMEDTAGLDEMGIGILEACGFQDLTGQRLKKALAALDRIVAEIDARDYGLGLLTDDPAYAAWQEANLVHGPAAPTEALGQDSIDDIFNSTKIE